MTVDDKAFDIVLSEEEAKGNVTVSYALEGKSDFKPLDVTFCEEEKRNAYVKLKGNIGTTLEPNYYG